MKAYVICCNDSIEFVVLDDEGKAKEKKEEMAKVDFERCKRQYILKEWEDYNEYRSIYYWHLHNVEYIS